jgi:hypothetical protein
MGQKGPIFVFNNGLECIRSIRRAHERVQFIAQALIMVKMDIFSFYKEEEMYVKQIKANYRSFLLNSITYLF